MKATAFFAGSFNPFTVGHADVVTRALQIFSHVVIGVGYNSNKSAAAEDSCAQVVRTIRSIYDNNDRVSVVAYSGLTVDAAKAAGATTLIRGVRGTADFDYESNLAQANMRIAQMDTVFFPARPDMAVVSSSLVRELQHHGHDVSQFLPQIEQ